MKSFIYGFVGMIASAVIIFLGYTAYIDHYLIKQLVEIEVRRQQAQQVAP